MMWVHKMLTVFKRTILTQSSDTKEKKMCLGQKKLIKEMAQDRLKYHQPFQSTVHMYHKVNEYLTGKKRRSFLCIQGVVSKETVVLSRCWSTRRYCTPI